MEWFGNRPAGSTIALWTAKSSGLAQGIFDEEQYRETGEEIPKRKMLPSVVGG
jgi:hypothetical protein